MVFGRIFSRISDQRGERLAVTPNEELDRLTHPLAELRAASFLLLRKERAHRVEVDSEVFLHGTRP